MNAPFMTVVLVSAALAGHAAPPGVGIEAPQGTGTCEFRSVPDVAFGLHTGATKDVTVTIGVACHANVRDVYIMMESPGIRRMSGPRPAMTSFIGYELYRRDAVGALLVWGSSMNQQSAYYLASPPNDVLVNVDLIARADAVSVPAGSYVDDLNVRMSWESVSGHNRQEITSARQVTATVGTACTVGATDLAFGNYDPLVVNGAGAGTDLNGSATITVSCSAGATPIVFITPGTGGRLMTGAGNLTYELYSDAGRTAIWGSTAGSAVKLPASTGTSQTLTVYGRIPRGQNVAVGAYSQTVIVTVNF